MLEHAGPTPSSACRPAETDATVWGVTLAASAARRAKWAARLVPLAGAVLSLGCGDDVRLRLLEPSEAILDAGADVTDVTDEGDGATRDASPAPPEPLHLYDFAGEGVTVVDRIGSADGEIVGGAELDGAGAVTLDGVDDFVDLPNQLLSGLTDLTISAWVEWAGGPCWQRIFDFGQSVQGETLSGYAQSSLFLTPSSCDGSHVGPVTPRVLLSMLHIGANVGVVEGSSALPEAERVFIALVFEAVSQRLSVYQDGSLQASAIVPGQLAELRDTNNWLGRSQWGQDPYFEGTFDELRIYGAALTEAQIQAEHAAGPTP